MNRRTDADGGPTSNLTLLPTRPPQIAIGVDAAARYQLSRMELFDFGGSVTRAAHNRGFLTSERIPLGNLFDRATR